MSPPHPGTALRGGGGTFIQAGNCQEEVSLSPTTENLPPRLAIVPSSGSGWTWQEPVIQ